MAIDLVKQFGSSMREACDVIKISREVYLCFFCMTRQRGSAQADERDNDRPISIRLARSLRDLPVRVFQI
jgi:hypothetical protein